MNPDSNLEEVEDIAKNLFSESPYLRCISDLSPSQLTDIDNYLHSLLLENSKALKKTHYFHHRYENLYLRENKHPALNNLIAEALSLSADFLQTAAELLSISYWFNLMEPGDVTTLHRHDDWDELISGVIYLTVPENSGNLILVSGGTKIELEPRIGNYLFFDPTTPHEVGENRSGQHRLSIGMNIGLKSGLLYQ